ncbi:MAG: hypothetical protein U1D70_00295 [Methylobacter sp.]|nr:hypothetical protein [Methylobacter sp.]
MDRQTFLEGFNAFITHKQLWQKIVEHGEPMPITVERDTDISSIGKASKHAYCLGRSASEKKEASSLLRKIPLCAIAHGEQRALALRCFNPHPGRASPMNLGNK